MAGGDAWPKHSPVLFPIVGQLKEHRYTHQEKEYSLPRHGFAREKMFSLLEQKDDQIIFRLSDDEIPEKIIHSPFISIFNIN
ncbi:MAG: hypothetical protein IPO63_04740 [Bacteroidetes bacterium]|nr:hypothetical protein [Bacteroidota bacterium]